jgi:hypothetical protein
MGRKNDIEAEKEKEAVEPKKPLFKKAESGEQAQPQVTIVTENQLVNAKLDTVLQKLDEVLTLAKN